MNVLQCEIVLLVINGQLYRRVPTSYTVREYFCHSTQRGPGPGWDFRWQLCEDDEYALRVAGRTFAPSDVDTTQALERAFAAAYPNLPFCHWELVSAE